MWTQRLRGKNKPETFCYIEFEVAEEGRDMMQPRPVTQSDWMHIMSNTEIEKPEKKK